MSENRILKAKIEDILKENLLKENVYFVFPSQTAADMWADRSTEITDIKAVASMRFMAWDQFKEQSIHSKDSSKTSIPSAMREIFTAQILSENASKPFLSYLITKEYSSLYSGFVSHISSLLPSLALWKKKFDEASLPPDEEDKDFLEIYNRYKAYLEKHNLFDPAWETPPFTKDGNKYFIFYPEIYSDYAEYQELLEEAEDIQIVNIPDEMPEIAPLKFFSNSRTEIRKVCEEIHQAHEKGIQWYDIAVSVPDMDTYAPYLQRDFDLYQIPYVMRSAKPLSGTTSGRFFKDAKTCVSGNFNFDSLKNLLFNSDLPWRGTKEIREFIRFGKRNHCVYNFEYNNEKIDVWEKSLAESSSDELLKNRYGLLKKDLSKLISSSTFGELRKRYFEFREDFFDMSVCSTQTDNILSRCISELSELIDLEEKFDDCKVKDCYSFFLNYLDEKNYLEQTTLLGVQLLPYKLAAASPFRCQVIVDGSQKGTSVIYKQLGFLSENKRIQICGKKNAENNVSDFFIKLYAMHSNPEMTFFNASLKTFSGYAQAASGIPVEDFSKVQDENIIFGDDVYHQEKEWITYEKKVPERFNRKQADFLKSWIERNKGVTEELNVFTTDKEVYKKLLKPRLYKDKYLRISARGDLEKFFDCPRKWFLSNLLHAEEIDNNAEIMDSYAIGKLNHRILELYCLELKRRNLPLKVNVRNEGETLYLDQNYEQILESSITTAMEDRDYCFMYRKLFESAKTKIETNALNAVLMLSKIFNEFLVYETEYDVSYLSEEGIYINGKIDLILKNQLKDEYIVVDYKTGKTPEIISAENLKKIQEEEKDLPLNRKTMIDFQMAMYVYLLSKEQTPKNIKAAAFYSLKEMKMVPVFGKDLNELCGIPSKYQIKDERKDFDGHIELLKEYISYMKEKIDAEDFSIDEEVQVFSTCSNCSYSSYCRRAYTTGKAE